MTEQHHPRDHHFSAAIRKLEFGKVLDRVAKSAVSEPGREAVNSVLPTSHAADIARSLDEVTAAKEILIEEHAIPLSSFRSILVPLKKTLVVNQSLTPKELLDVGLVLRTSRDMNVFLRRRTERYPVLAQYVSGLFADKVVEYNIAQAIDEEGGIKDSASRDLRQIRNDMVASREALQRRLAAILRKVSEQEFAQDDIITTRDGRLVIPVKTEFKGRVAGFIHSSSASGATVYVEPTETLELNNGFRELQIQEQREIQRILTELTRQVAEIRSPLEVAFQSLVALDVIFAKARFSIEIIGTAPTIARTPTIRIREGRHPVLLIRHPRSEVVPLDLDLGSDHWTLVITGPNAGGKTVALKTVGLLTLCAMAGLHIPAGSETEVFPFPSMFVDIGDDQDLENDLSTFSSHLVHLREILQNADAASLVLVDEIGSGTDPEEGGALAAAVLNELTKRHALTIATTHHGTLKVFAHSAPGVQNGSMEFDQRTLKPTFCFRAGVPGSSFALALAERIGLDKEVLAKARESMGSEKTRLESLLVELEQLRQEARTDRAHLERDLVRSQSLMREYEQRMRELERNAKDIRAHALAEARRLLDEGRRTLEHAVREVRESAGDKGRIREARTTVNSFTSFVDKAVQDMGPPSEDAEVRLMPGDRVKLKSGGQAAELTEITGETATIVAGTMRMKVRLKDLVKATDAPRQSPSSAPMMELPAASREIDVRGMLGDEAVASVEHAIEHAVVGGLHRLDIIHGKGTGALRKRIAEYLKTAPNVVSYRLGEWNEGGTGVTVVELE
ncbi:MAG: hypothetical protein A3C56_11290 [Ignavibacteria bacterium RIFCSPHIGHO2_02_FULL_56_12]|nr:MAG: hypothetical protein A3C56_11290 [Ignavibacteria bacterium RIFCSPHIGHO2_02_FULL_56_12]